MRRFYRLIKFSSNSNWLFIKFLQLPDIRKQVAHILCRLLSPTSTKVRVWHHSAILLDWLNAPCRWQAMNNRCIFYSSVTVKVDSNTGKNSMITSVITTYERRLLWPRSKGIYIIGSFIWMAGISTAQTKLLLPIMETRYWIGFILTEILMAKALDCFFHNSFTHCTFHRLFYMQSNRGVLDFTMCTLSDAYNILDVAIWDYWMLTHKKHLTYSFKNRPLS